MGYSSSKRFLITFHLLSLLCLCLSDRLSLSDGGYARLVGSQQNPIESFTIASWINVTKFPEGIAPIVTYFNNDINSQVAFFVRPDGIGILWGGPVSSQPNVQPGISRRPRYHWGQIAGGITTRRRREAVDYRGGLGDVENILEKRIGRSDNFWAPMNFVDVRDLGVDDLMMSGSQSGNAYYGSQHSPGDGWTDVPYELHMNADAAPAASIITQPSEANKYVNFSWDNASKKEKPVATRNNNWAPPWESSRERVAEDISEQQYNGPTAQSNRPNQNIDNSNAWNPVDEKDLVTKLLPTKYERPIWPSRSTQIKLPINIVSSTRPTITPIDNNIRHRIKPLYGAEPNRDYKKPYNRRTTTLRTTTPPTSKPTTTEQTTTRSQQVPRQNFSRQNVPRRNYVPSLFRYQQNRYTTSTTPVPTTKTPITPIKRKIPKARVPLWKLVNKPAFISYRPTTPRNPTTPKKSTSSNIKYETRRYQYFPEPTLPPFKPTQPSAKLQSAHSKISNTYRSRPVHSPSKRIPSRRITVKPILAATSTTTTPSPVSTTRFPVPSTHSPISTTPKKRQPTPITYKVPNYQGSKLELKETTTDSKYSSPRYSIKNIYKTSSLYTNKRINEFEKTMKKPEMFKEGNTAVVYAVPITNENEFYKMYKKYQQETRQDSNNLNKMYNEMRKGKPGKSEQISNNSFNPTRYTTVKPAPSTTMKFTTVPSSTSSRGDISIDYINSPTEGPQSELPEYEYEYVDEDGNIVYEYYDEDLLASIYTPSPNAVTQTSAAKPSYYQEPTILHHEQLLPQIQKSDKQNKFSAPLPIPGGFVPLPEYINQPAINSPITKEESDLWVFKNQNEPIVAAPSPIYNQNPMIPILPSQLPTNPFANNLPRYPQPPPLSQQPPPMKSVPQNPVIAAEPELNIRFEKVPYEFNENGWYHVAYTWDAMTKLFKIYVNGEIIGEITNVLSEQTELKEGGIFMLGRTLLPDLTDFDSSSQFEGEISDLNLWAMKMESTNIDSLFQCKYDPTSPKPIDWESSPMQLYNEASMVQSPPFCGLVT